MGCWEVVVSRKRVFQPEEPALQRWNMIFLMSCMFALALDPLFFYVPVINTHKKCLTLDSNLEKIAIILRSSIDIFYIIRVVFQFRTGFSAVSARIFERTIMVDDPWQIAKRYMLSFFIIDVLATLPLPQVAILLVIPRMGGSRIWNTKRVLKYVVSIQLIPRFLRFCLLNKKYKETIKNAHGPSRNARCTIVLYICAGHVIGAFWYLISIEREMECWLEACGSHAGCNRNDLFCSGNSDPNQQLRFLDVRCPADLQGRSPFDYGMFIDAHNSGILGSRSFFQKLFYCSWWALQSLSTLGQNLKTSTRCLEMLFAASIFICGLVLFSFVIGIIQATMLTSTIRAQEMKMKWQDVEHWMDSHFFPPTLRKRVRRYELHRWKKTKGLDVENFLHNFPKYLRRDIKHHLCWNLLLSVPMFELLGEEKLKQLCESLKPVYYIEESDIVRKGEPVDEMLFITRGRVLSSSGDDGIGYSEYLEAGNCFGEELLTWASEPHSSSDLPISTRTVRTLTEVEAFALMADDLEFVFAQYRRLHSKQRRNTFRFWSHQWQTWAACCIQATWRRYKMKKLEECRRLAMAKTSGSSPNFGATIYALRFAANVLRPESRKLRKTKCVPAVPFQKPPEPDFEADEQ